jgi:hypothetical protein
MVGLLDVSSELLILLRGRRRPALSYCRWFWSWPGSLRKEAERSDRNDDRDDGEEKHHVSCSAACRLWIRAWLIRHASTLTLIKRLGQWRDRRRQPYTRQRQSKNRCEDDGKAENRTPTAMCMLVVW